MKYSVELSLFDSFEFEVDAASVEEAEDKAVEMARASLAKKRPQDFDLDIDSVDELEEA